MKNDGGAVARCGAVMLSFMMFHFLLIFYIYAYNKLFIGVVEGDSMEHYLLHNSNVINREGYHLIIIWRQADVFLELQIFFQDG